MSTPPGHRMPATRHFELHIAQSITIRIEYPPPVNARFKCHDCGHVTEVWWDPWRVRGWRGFVHTARRARRHRLRHHELAAPARRQVLFSERERRNRR